MTRSPSYALAQDMADIPERFYQFYPINAHMSQKQPLIFDKILQERA